MKTNSGCIHNRASCCAILNISLFGWKSCKVLLVSIFQQSLTTMIPMDHFPLEMLPNHQRDKYPLLWWSTPSIPQLSECESPHSWLCSTTAATAVSLYLIWPWGKANRDGKVVMFPFCIWLSWKGTGLALQKPCLKRGQSQHFAFICFKLLGTISGKYQLPRSSVNFCFGQQFMIIFGAHMLYTWAVQLNFFQTLFIEERTTTVLQSRALA